MTDMGTKEKILGTALRLFGSKGFDSVSVREISKEAGVNVSAINYHFENKENLFREVIKGCVDDMRAAVTEMYESEPDCDADKLTLKIFDYFLENGESLRLSFKMTILDGHKYTWDIKREDDFLGPPGGKVMYDAILRYKPEAKEEDVIWAVRTIFGLVVHKGLVCCSGCVDHDSIPNMTVNDVKKSLSRAVRVVLEDL